MIFEKWLVHATPRTYRLPSSLTLPVPSTILMPKICSERPVGPKSGLLRGLECLLFHGGWRGEGKKPAFPLSLFMAWHTDILICPFRAWGPRVDRKCKVSKISSVSPAQGRSLNLEMEKPEPGSAPLERRGGREGGSTGR